VDVSGIRQTVTRSVGLLLPDAVYATTQRTVQVTVEVRPEDAMRTRRSGSLP
jgi:YbbR domain-containing protein